LNRFNSSGRRQGIAPFAPMTRFFAIATMIEIRDG
jgi:hypothetical protein